MLSRAACLSVFLVLPLLLLVLGGCESSGSSIKNVDVVYRFDNVRKSASFDEWPAVRSVLAKHATSVSANVDQVRSAGPVEVRSYKAIVNVPNVRAIDLIQRDLEALASTKLGSDRVQFTLAALQADYRSNILTAGVQSTVGGYATPGYTVLVYPFEGSAPLPTVAGTDGRWSQRLTTLPQTRWVYASVQDPKRRMPDKFYRINISTQQQELMEQAEFARIFPPGKAPIPASVPPHTPSVASAMNRSGGGEPAAPLNLVSDDSDAVKSRAAEDDRIRLMREREEEGRRKRRELEERIDQRLRDAERRERTGR